MRGNTAVALLVCAAAGCGVRVDRYSHDTKFTPASGKTVALAHSVEIDTAGGALPSASREKLAKGTRWRGAGRITEGDVYECVDGVFMLDARHNHETYIVVAKDELVGLFVPVKKLYAPLEEPVPIRFEGR